jgi:hypothetical protein
MGAFGAKRRIESMLANVEIRFDVYLTGDPEKIYSRSLFFSSVAYLLRHTQVDSGLGTRFA